MILIAVFVQLLVLDVRVGEFWPLILIAVGIVILIKSFQSRRGRSGDELEDSPNSVNVLGSERTVAPSDQDTIHLETVMGSRHADDHIRQLQGRTRLPPSWATPI